MQRCRVNVSTGLHVHVDARGRDLPWFKNLFRIYHRWEEAIDSFMSPSRRGSGGGSFFCQSLMVNKVDFDAAVNLDQVRTSVGQGGMQWRSSARYRKLNFLSFLEFGTVEFRQHQGTVEPQKTEMWIRLLLKMADKAGRTSKEEIEQQSATLEALLEFIDMDQTEQGYFVERREHFARLERRQ
jgi:hypothetical protein